MSISVLGAGAFGTALAISLAHKGPITLWARDPGDMKQRRTNAKRLPGAAFPDALTVTGDIRQATSADTILLAVPMQKLRPLLQQYQSLLGQKSLVACCKGIELGTLQGPVSLIETTIPGSTAAILTGPSFAADIAKGLPTALTLAARSNDTASALQGQLSTDHLRLYRSTDTVGAELGGALKNVIAIACGAAMGANLGESARAALITRGYAEMKRLAQHLGAQPVTLSGLSGFGDLTLTCTSTQSRNYRLGLSLGRGQTPDPGVTVEGAATAEAIDTLAQRDQLDLPITRAVAALLRSEIDIATAMAQLLNRPLKEE